MSSGPWHSDWIQVEEQLNKMVHVSLLYDVGVLNPRTVCPSALYSLSAQVGPAVISNKYMPPFWWLTILKQQLASFKLGIYQSVWHDSNLALSN